VFYTVSTLLVGPFLVFYDSPLPWCYSKIKLPLRGTASTANDGDRDNENMRDFNRKIQKIGLSHKLAIIFDRRQNI
jgi:hypothetical protein